MLFYVSLYLSSVYTRAKQYSEFKANESNIPATISVNQCTPDRSRPITVTAISKPDIISLSKAMLSFHADNNETAS